MLYILYTIKGCPVVQKVTKVAAPTWDRPCPTFTTFIREMGHKTGVLGLLPKQSNAPKVAIQCL